MPKRQYWALAVSVLIVAFFAIHPDALAAGSTDWVGQPKTLLDSFKSGAVQLGAPIIGIAVVGLGFLACLAGRMPWEKFGYILFGGFLIMGGPALVTSFLALLKK